MKFRILYTLALLLTALTVSAQTYTYDNLNRLTNFGGTGVTYDDNGNILSKGDVGSFAYTVSGKPFAVSEVTLSNSISAGAQSVSYNSFERPATITDNGYTVSFTYNSDYDRVKMTKVRNSQTQLIRYYLGGCYELDIKPSGTTEKLYLNGGYYDAPAVLIKQGSSSSVYNIVRDHLGSVTRVYNASGTLVQELSYDAWGRMRDPSTFTLYAPMSEPEPYLGRGYCGHEHLTGLGLINMNARLYDPVLGRFLAADPFVQAPNMTQNFNRYSYCLNNPLRYSDVTGTLFGIDDAILFVAIGVVVGAYVGGAVANDYQWNPAKWNYSSMWTYAGIVGGGLLGGYAGSAIAAGNLLFSASAITPFGAVGINYWNDKNNNRHSEVEFNTIAGGHWNSAEEKAVKNTEEAYDEVISNYVADGERIFNSLCSNLSINSSAIRYYGPYELKHNAYILAKYSNRTYYLYNMANIGTDILSNKDISPYGKQMFLESTGENVASSIGGYIMGAAMSGLFCETGPGSIYAGIYGYVAGSYIGGFIGRNIGNIVHESWYNLYNVITPIEQMQNYTKTIQNSYQPIW